MFSLSEVIRRSVYLALGEHLQCLELVPIEPHEVADGAAIDLEGMLVVEVPAHHGPGAARAANEVGLGPALPHSDRAPPLVAGGRDAFGQLPLVVSEPDLPACEDALERAV